MNDLLTALKICLDFLPADGKTVGGRDLNATRIYFTARGVNLYATNGHVMVRVSLGGIETPGKSAGPIDLSKAGVSKIMDEYSSTHTTSVATWGGELIIVGDSGVTSVPASQCLPAHNYPKFFEPKPAAPHSTVSLNLLQSSIVPCQPVMASYKGVGPAISISVQAGEDDHHLVIISPKITPGMEHLRAIDIALMGLSI